MTRHRLMPALADVGAGLATTALPLATAPARAAGPVNLGVSGALVAAHGQAPTQQQVSQLSSVRDRQARMIAAHQATPTFAAKAATLFTVNTTEDSDVASLRTPVAQARATTRMAPHLPWRGRVRQDVPCQV